MEPVNRHIHRRALEEVACATRLPTEPGGTRTAHGTGRDHLCLLKRKHPGGGGDLRHWRAVVPISVVASLPASLADRKGPGEPERDVVGRRVALFPEQVDDIASRHNDYWVLI